MTNEPAAHVQIAPAYDKQFFWLILPVLGTAEPKIRKTDPGRLSAGEFCLKLEVLTPRRRTQVQQTVRVTLPEEFTHLASIDVEVAVDKPATPSPGR